MGTSLKCLTISALLALTLVIPAEAQVERASIIGNVTDKTGAALGGVVVTVTQEETNTSITVSTSETGGFTAVNLIPGSYTISASHPGFASVTYRNFVVQVSQQARRDFVMELGALEQSVEVTAAAPLLQTENRALTFRWEMFNALNHPQFGLPAATVGVGAAGTITSTQRGNRQMQFALRLSF